MNAIDSFLLGLLIFAESNGAVLAALPNCEFSAPVKVECQAAQFGAQLSRSATSNLVVDSSGTVRLVWWTGPEATSPTNPSAVYHASWTKSKGWSNQLLVAGSPETFSGRHPSIAAVDGGNVWVAWHDHRNCSPSASYIDNVEIYASKISGDGNIVEDSIRVTQTSAEHKGDNGYCPKLVSADDGQVRLAWYDFNGNYGISDEYFGLLAPSMNLSTSRLSDSSTHMANAYTVCDLSHGAGRSALVWVAGLGWMQDLMYMEIDDSGQRRPPVILAPDDVSFFDPPCIRISSVNGETVVLWPSQEFEESQLKTRRKPFGSSDFGVVADIDAQPGRTQRYVDAEFDLSGNLHIVWCDNRNGKSDIWYQVRKFDSSEILASKCLTQSTSQIWGRPTLCLDHDGIPYVVAETTGSGLWFIPPAPKAAIFDWQNYGER